MAPGWLHIHSVITSRAGPIDCASSCTRPLKTRQRQAGAAATARKVYQIQPVDGLTIMQSRNCSGGAAELDRNEIITREQQNWINLNNNPIGPWSTYAGRR